MKTFIFAFILAMTALAQSSFIPPTQDHPDLVWKKLENENFKIIYPGYLENRAKYILNLLEYFRDKVGQSYSVTPKKFTLIIRAQMSEPNGFVTLAPRRSEWFSSAAITPMVGSLDWYQALAVHEYRHIIQMDYLNRPHVDVGYALFGEAGLAVVMNWITPGWFFEGDAVYTETKYTDAGRGRSPRFLARMKALVASDNIPSYDQFLAGDYTNSFPNHYVYGYLLITRAYREFGDHIWADIMARAARKAYNPWAIYNAFEDITGVRFATFYKETMQELKQMWELEIPKQDKLYTRVDYPQVADNQLYYLKKDLDSYWQLIHKQEGKETKLAAFNIAPSLSRVDLKNGKFVYTIAFSHPRYMFKGHSDLYLYDIKNQHTERLTDDERLYHPVLHPTKKEIMAVEFDQKNAWSLRFFDLQGKKLDQIQVEDGSITEAIYLEGEKIGVIILDELGMRSVAVLDRSTKKVQKLLGPSRNNFYSLAKGNNSLLFEADYDGKVNIFEISLSGQHLGQCTHEQIAAYRPYVHARHLYYSAEVANGSELKKVSYDCSPLKASTLVGYDYLGKGPSDNYVGSDPEPLKLSKSELTKVKETPSLYNTFEGAEKPHSWSFLGRGFQLGVTAQNMLSTFFWSAAVGHSSVESRPYADLSIGYAKYFPIFSLNMSYADRRVRYEEEGPTDQWSEALVGVSMSVPLTFQRNLFTQNMSFNMGVAHLAVSDRDENESYEQSGEQLMVTTAGISFSNLKQKTFRQLIPSWGQSLNLIYQNAEAQEQESFSSYMTYAGSNLYFPSAVTNHGLKLSGYYESHKDDVGSYRFQSPGASPTGYIYSRGYIQDYFPKYSKLTLDYYLPIAYPNAGFKDYFYFNRIFANAFYDNTLLDGEAGDTSFRSYGAEMHFESLTFRKLPLVYSLRFYKKLDDDGEDHDGGIDFFLGTIFDI